MKLIEIQGISGSSKILVGEKIENLEAYIPAGKAIIITDKNVGQIYRKKFPSCELIEIGTKNKKS